MSVFSGGCDRVAAQAVCGEHAPLNQLVAKSLLHRDEEGRYWMHEQTRQFAAEHLWMLGATDAARELHAAHYLGLAASHAAQINGPHASAIIAALKVEYGNLRRAWGWAARSVQYGLLAEAAPVFRQIYAASDLAEGALQFGEALARIEGTTAEALQARQQLLNVLVGQLRATGQADAALAHARDLLDLARAAGDPVGEAVAILHLADLAIDRGDFARAWGKLSIADQLSAGQPSRQGRIVNAHALLKQASLIDVQQLPVDERYAQRAYELYTALDMPIYAAMALNRLGNHQRRCGDYGRAIEARLRAAALIADQGDLDVSTGVLNDLGEMYMLVGCYQDAHATFVQALAMARRLGATKIHVNILEGLARSLFHIGDLGSARAHIEEALDVDARRAMQMHQGYYLTTLGYIAEREGNWDAAGRHYHEAQRWWEQSSHDSDAVAEPRVGLARVALAQRQPEEATEHVEMVLPLLARAPLQDALEPMWVHWSCYQALVAVGDGRAGAVIGQAHELLRRQAMQISDPYLRGSFLNRVAAHRDIVAACKAAGE
jgi:tetratricopeptide (TPR) repeat protein